LLPLSCIGLLASRVLSDNQTQFVDPLWRFTIVSHSSDQRSRLPQGWVLGPVLFILYVAGRPGRTRLPPRQLNMLTIDDTQIYSVLLLGASTTSRVGCGGRIGYNPIRRRQKSCGARLVGASIDYLPPCTLTIGSTTVAPVFSVHELGIFVVSELVMCTHMCETVSGASCCTLMLRCSFSSSNTHR